MNAMNQPKSLLRFRLRTLFLLVLGVGVLLTAWRRAWVEPYRVQREAMRAIAKAGGYYQTEASGPAWLRSAFGEDWFQDVTVVDLSRGADGELLEHLFCLPRLSQLWVGGRAFTDAHLARLSRFSELKEAVLTSTSVSRESVDAMERDRPDILLRIGLSFDELTGLLSGTRWDTDSAWQFNVPTSVRQWEGRRVEIVGVAYPDTSGRWVTNVELLPRDILVPPRWRVVVVLRSAQKSRDWDIWHPSDEVTVEGRLDIAPDLSDYGKPVYRLSDAAISVELP